MFERFTDRARRVVVLAQNEARGLNHNYIGTEHLLLGLIEEGEGVAAKALEMTGIEPEAVRATVVEMIVRALPLRRARFRSLRERRRFWSSLCARLFSWAITTSARSICCSV